LINRIKKHTTTWYANKTYDYKLTADMPIREYKTAIHQVWVLS